MGSWKKSQAGDPMLSALEKVMLKTVVEPWVCGPLKTVAPAEKVPSGMGSEGAKGMPTGQGISGRSLLTGGPGLPA